MKERFSWMSRSYNSVQTGSALLFTVLLLIQLMLCAVLIQKKFFRGTDIVIERIKVAQQEIWLESWVAWSAALLKTQFEQWEIFLQGQPKKTLTFIIPGDKKNRSIEAVACAFTAIDHNCIGITVTINQNKQSRSHYRLYRSITHDEQSSFSIKRYRSV